MAERVIRFADGKITEIEINENRKDPEELEW